MAHGMRFLAKIQLISAREIVPADDGDFRVAAAAKYRFGAGPGRPRISLDGRRPLSYTARSRTAKSRRFAGVAQLVRAPACHAGGRGFESRHSRHIFQKYSIKPLKNKTFAASPIVNLS